MMVRSMTAVHHTSRCRISFLLFFSAQVVTYQPLSRPSPHIKYSSFLYSPKKWRMENRGADSSCNPHVAAIHQLAEYPNRPHPSVIVILSVLKKRRQCNTQTMLLALGCFQSRSPAISNEPISPARRWRQHPPENSRVSMTTCTCDFTTITEE